LKFIEKILYSNQVIKINRYNISQQRNLVITTNGIYNLKKKNLKRRIAIKDVIGVSVCKTNNEFVIHCCDLEYDYNYETPDVKKIVEILYLAYKEVNQKYLHIFEVELKDIKNVVTQKEDKKKNPNYSKMPTTGQILMYEQNQKQDFPSEKKVEISYEKDKYQNKIQNAETQSTKVDKTAKLEDFKIIKVIGRGSYGKICLVEHKTKELYAMKSLKKNILLDHDQIENILQEKKILSTIKHPFLVSMSYCFQTTERVYFIMDFMRGGDLFEHLRKFRMFNEDE